MTVSPETAELLAQGVRAPEALAFNSDGQQLVVAQRGGRLDTFDCATHTLAGPPRQCALTEAWLTPAEPACLDQDGRWLARIDQNAPRVARCWDTQTGRERAALRGHTQRLRLVTISADGGRIATAGGPSGDEALRGEVKVWEGADGQPLFGLDETDFLPTRLGLSPAGDRLAVAGQQFNPVPGQEEPRVAALLRVYDLPGGRLLRSFSTASDVFLALAFSPDGKRLAAAG